MSSWQASAVSLFLRIMSKSALRVTSVDFSEASVAALRRQTRHLTEHHAGSRRENRWLDPMLIPGRQTMRRMYVGGDEDLLCHPHVSPAYGDFSGFPPLLFHVGDTEILRDDSVRVAEKARAAGTPADVEIWKGVPHVWHALPFLPEANRALSRIGEFVRSCTVTIDHENGPTKETRTTL